MLHMFFFIYTIVMIGFLVCMEIQNVILSLLFDIRALRCGTSILKTPLTVVTKKTCFKQCWLNKKKDFDFDFKYLMLDYEFCFEIKQE